MALSALAWPAAAAAAPADDRGPVALRKAAIGQDLRHGSIRFAVRNDLPPLRALQLFPDRIRGAERRLCLAADGRAMKKRLICIGGRTDRGRVRIGVSRYFKNGSAKKLGGFWAQLDDHSRRSVRVSFLLRKAGISHGRFRWWAGSSWRGASCADETPVRGKKRRRREAHAEALCRSRYPDRGTERGKIAKLVRTGCTTGNLGSVRRGPRRQKLVALTFDDGPSSYTRSIMRALDKQRAAGTFFVVGNQTFGNTALMRKLLARGHELANHSYAHEQYPGSASIGRTTSLIKSATGFTPCSFRPPYGSYNSSTVAAARSYGMSNILWDIDTIDWQRPPPSTIYSRAIKAGRGSIVLMHDGGGPRGNTVAAVPDIVRKLRSRGYKLVTVTRLLGGRFKLAEKR